MPSRQAAVSIPCLPLFVLTMASWCRSNAWTNEWAQAPLCRAETTAKGPQSRPLHCPEEGVLGLDNRLDASLRNHYLFLKFSSLMKVAAIYSIGVGGRWNLPLSTNHWNISCGHPETSNDFTRFALQDRERRKRKKLVLHLRFPATTKSKRLKREVLGEF